MSYISLPAFLISFAIGIFFIYIWGADQKIVYIYPCADTVNNVLFKNSANKCYELQETEVKCPSNKEGIFTPPVQQ